MSAGGDRILGPGERAVRANGDKVLEDRVTRTRVAEATKDESDRKCSDGTSMIDDVGFVPRVKDVMVAKGWKLGAQFQAIWLGSPANQLVGKARDGRGTKGPLKLVEASVDWVLTYERTRAAFDELQDPKVFANDKARKEINSIAERNFKADPTATEVQLGNFAAKGAARDQDFVNYRAVDTYAYGYTYEYAHGLDDLTASLARFAFFVIPGGSARRQGTVTQVTIDRVGIYFRDSFDFNDEQFLGWWHLPNEAQDTPPSKTQLKGLPAMDSEFRCATAWFQMSNAVYRRYRERTGLGGDFLIYSDVKEIALKEPLMYYY